MTYTLVCHRSIIGKTIGKGPAGMTHTFSVVGVGSGRVGVGFWTNWRLGSASVPSFWPGCVSRRESGSDFACSNLWERRGISPWSSRWSPRRPRWSSAADTCVSVGTCPRLPTPGSSPFQPPRTFNTTQNSNSNFLGLKEENKRRHWRRRHLFQNKPTQRWGVGSFLGGGHFVEVPLRKIRARAPQKETHKKNKSYITIYICSHKKGNHFRNSLNTFKSYIIIFPRFFIRG